jgi:hypothetical protein
MAKKTKKSTAAVIDDAEPQAPFSASEPATVPAQPTATEHPEEEQTKQSHVQSAVVEGEEDEDDYLSGAPTHTSVEQPTDDHASSTKDITAVDTTKPVDSSIQPAQPIASIPPIKQTLVADDVLAQLSSGFIGRTAPHAEHVGKAIKEITYVLLFMETA